MATPVITHKRRRKKKLPPPAAVWRHAQKSPQCCETYRAAHNHGCWSCANNEMLKTPLGKAILAGYGSVGASNWEPARPARSVLDCLEMAEG